MSNVRPRPSMLIWIYRSRDRADG